MLKIETLLITDDVPFQMYLLSDRLVKKLNKEFDFYNVRFYRVERVKEFTVGFDFPSGNPYWFMDFKKFIINDILAKDCRYERSWNDFLERLKRRIKSVHDNWQKGLNDAVTNKNICKAMFDYNLRSYQARDMLELSYKMSQNTLPAGLILSEQRTGKTRVALATVLQNNAAGTIINVIAPKSAILGWESELNEMNNYFEENVFLTQTVQKLQDLKQLSDTYHPNAYNVRLITYGLFKMMSHKQVREFMSPTLCKDSVLICDEAHRLRNFTTLQSTAVFDFIKTCLKEKMNLKVIGLTGTPAVKDSYDVFGTLSFVNFSKMCFQPYQKDFNVFKEYFYNCEDTSYGKVCKSLRRTAELTYIMQSCAIQTKQMDLDVFKNYSKKYLKYELDLDEKQKEIYKGLCDTMEFENVDCINGLVQLMRLQETCVDPNGLVASYDLLAPKLEWVTKFVLKNSIQIIVMSKRLRPLEHLAEQLSKHGISYAFINGTLNNAERLEEIRMFKTHEAQVFLIQLDVGKESLTLPEAKCTIFLDRDFAQGYNEQAEARMTPVDGLPHTKYVIDLVMKNTVEEKIYDVLINRKQSIDNVNTVFKS